MASCSAGCSNAQAAPCPASGAWPAGTAGSGRTTGSSARWPGTPARRRSARRTRRLPALRDAAACLGTSGSGWRAARRPVAPRGLAPPPQPRRPGLPRERDDVPRPASAARRSRSALHQNTGACTGGGRQAAAAYVQYCAHATRLVKTWEKVFAWVAIIGGGIGIFLLSDVVVDLMR